MINVLITAVGDFIGQGLLKSLRRSSYKLNIIGADINPESAGIFMCDKGYIVPPAQNKTRYLKRIIDICKDEKIEEALVAGADIAGSVEIIDDIKNGKIDFDVCIATPNMMPVIGAVARILGPKGLMPNPKLGTVTTDIVTAVKNAKGGQVEYRVEKAGIIHAGVGKLSFSKQDLLNNISALISAVVKAKPSGAKGNYLKAIYLSSTMGPSVKIDISSIS